MSRFSISGFGSKNSGWRRIPSVLSICFALAFLFAFVLVFSPEPREWNPLSSGFWFTPDQQGDRLMRRGAFTEAAQSYRNPMCAGVAWYRAGEFKEAARAFGRLNIPEGQFNRGNALIMQGKYTEAIEEYEKALASRPDWREAETNLEIARLRAEMVKTEGGDMTGGMLAEDGFVFTSGKKDGGEQGQAMEEGNELSDRALQAMWLRRIQTKPADFLRAKFAYQLSREGGK